MEQSPTSAMEHLRQAIAQDRIEAAGLFGLVENGATPKIRMHAKGNLEQLTRQIQARLNELTKVESE